MDLSAQICEWQVAWISDLKSGQLTLASSIWGIYWLSRLQQCQMTSVFRLKWLELSALDHIGKDSGLIWLDRDSSGWLVGGWRTIRIISEEEARWISPLPPNDCVVIRRLVAVITDYWGGYSSCHTHAPTLSKAPSHSCHTVCHMSHVIHVTCDTLSSALSLSHLCSGFACFLASELQQCTDKIQFIICVFTK